MDKQELKELEHNDLAEFFTNFRKFWDKYGTPILLILLICVGSWVGLRWWNAQAAEARDNAWGAYYEASSAIAYEQVAAKFANNPTISTLAKVSMADNLMMEAILESDLPFPTDETEDENTSSLSPEKKIERASVLYEEVINTLPHRDLPSLVKLNARMGLAGALEQQRKFDEARVQYESVIEEAGPYDALRVKAETLLRNLDSLKTEIVFADDTADFEDSSTPAPPATTPEMVIPPGIAAPPAAVPAVPESAPAEEETETETESTPDLPVDSDEPVNGDE